MFPWFLCAFALGYYVSYLLVWAGVLETLMMAEIFLACSDVCTYNPSHFLCMDSSLFFLTANPIKKTSMGY
jgi:hypothetical protein